MPRCRECAHYEPAPDPEKGYCWGQLVWGKQDASECPVAAFRYRTPPGTRFGRAAKNGRNAETVKSSA